MSLHFPAVKLGYTDWMAPLVWFQMGSLVHGIEVLACSFDTGFSYIQPILTIIYVIREMESVMILPFAGILQFSKVLILLV